MSDTGQTVDGGTLDSLTGTGKDMMDVIMKHLVGDSDKNDGYAEEPKEPYAEEEPPPAEGYAPEKAEPVYEEPAYGENPEYGEKVAPEDVKGMLDYMGVPEEKQYELLDKIEAGDNGYAKGEVLDVILSDNSVVNEIWQGNDIHGEVHGGAWQTNENTTVTASGDGSNASGGAQYDATVQSGSGVNVGGDSYGVTNQGDNSGQQAGDNAVNHGDFTSGSDNISLDGAYVEGSNVNFGEGGKVYGDASADDNYDSFNDHSKDIDAKLDVSDSLNATHSSEYTTDETYTTTTEDSYNVEVTTTTSQSRLSMATKTTTPVTLTTASDHHRLMMASRLSI